MWDELFDLKGKRAVVTGGSSGIGLAIAQALGRAGVQVAIVNRNREAGAKAAAGLKEEGLVVASYAADVTDEGQVRETFACIEDEQGPTDILINSHGINIRKPVFEFSLDEWRKIIEINLTGAFITCQTMGRAMVERGSGSIVNVSSIVSLRGPDRAGALQRQQGRHHPAHQDPGVGMGGQGGEGERHRARGSCALRSPRPWSLSRASRQSWTNTCPCAGWPRPMSFWA